MEKIKHGLCLFFALFVLMTTAVFAGFTPVNTVLAAENSENNFDDTAVTDDLSEYDLSQFVYDKNGSVQFVTLAEYCFSASALNMEKRAEYGKLCAVCVYLQPRAACDLGAARREYRQYGNRV